MWKCRSIGYGYNNNNHSSGGLVDGHDNGGGEELPWQCGSGSCSKNDGFSGGEVVNGEGNYDGGGQVFATAILVTVVED